jgi:hypothetical protein
VKLGSVIDDSNYPIHKFYYSSGFVFVIFFLFYIFFMVVVVEIGFLLIFVEGYGFFVLLNCVINVFGL